MLEPRLSEDSAKTSEVFRYEWPIYGLAQLRHHVEDCPGGVWTVEMEMEDPESLPESLRAGKIIGPGWFKLDLARTIPHPHSPKTPVEEIVTTLATENKCIDTLSLYIAALSLDSGPTEIRYPASLFVGIKPIYTPTDLPAGTSYHWSKSTEWEFTPHNEFWEVQLPKMSQLLSDPNLRDQDGFTLCIEIATPEAIGPTFSRPDKIEVDAALINGLRSLVDSITGDVAFVCLEHDTSRSSSKGIEATDTEPRPLSRKRVIYAHSEILKSASDFFHALLTGDFEEAGRARRGEARHTPIIVDDADYQAVYWVLRYIYTKEISFAETDDVRNIMDQLQIERQEIIRALSESSKLFGPAEWEYRRLLRQGEELEDLEEMDVRTVMSVSSISTRRSAISPTPSTSTRANEAKPNNPTRPVSSKSNSMTATPTKTTGLAQDSSTRARTGKPMLAASPSTSKTTVVGEHKPSKTSPAPNRPTYIPRAPDPHTHPCASPGPASALSVFMLSHRYGLDKLEAISKAHILEGLTPENCMPMLLASYRYETLHSDIFDFILSHWDAVQSSEELAKCVDEVSAGVWGETGGRVILGLFRRL